MSKWCKDCRNNNIPLNKYPCNECDRTIEKMPSKYRFKTDSTPDIFQEATKIVLEKYGVESIKATEEIQKGIYEVLGQDNVNPAHYKTGNIEVYEYIQDKLTKEELEGYLTGNIMKYISRYRHKNGVEDLKKANWYLDKLIQSLEVI